MRFKLDECVDGRLASVLEQAGHEATTMAQQGLLGSSDDALYNHCITEGLVVLSLDKDFSNVFRFPPGPTQGIVVLRGANNLFSTMLIMVETLIEAIPRERPKGKLWIVEPGRLRVHEPTDLWDDDRA